MKKKRIANSKITELTKPGKRVYYPIDKYGQLKCGKTIYIWKTEENRKERDLNLLAQSL